MAIKIVGIFLIVFCSAGAVFTGIYIPVVFEMRESFAWLAAVGLISGEAGFLLGIVAGIIFLKY